MSAPDRISICPDFPDYQWNDGETIPPKEWPIYLSLDGPTLQAVREALARAETWVNGAGDRPEPMLRQLRAALKLLEGK